MFRFTRKPSSGSHSQYLAKITHLVKSGYVELLQDVVSVMAAYCDLWGVCTVHCVRVYAHTVHGTLVSQVKICSHNTDNVLYELYVSTFNQVCNFSQVLTVAPWWWFPCKPKHVGAVFLILKYFNNSTFFNVVCISWKLKSWILLMHGVTMKTLLSVLCYSLFGLRSLINNLKMCRNIKWVVKY